VYGEGLCLFYTEYYHGYQVKEYVFTQASEVYVRDDKAYYNSLVGKIRNEEAN